jgi:hypothetical protein
MTLRNRITVMVVTSLVAAWDPSSEVSQVSGGMSACECANELWNE